MCVALPRPAPPRTRSRVPQEFYNWYQAETTTNFSMVADRDRLLQSETPLGRLAAAARQVKRVLGNFTETSAAKKMMIARARDLAMSRTFGAFRKAFPPPFTCAVCLRAFALRGELLLHMELGCGTGGNVWFRQSVFEPARRVNEAPAVPDARPQSGMRTSRTGGRTGRSRRAGGSTARSVSTARSQGSTARR